MTGCVFVVRFSASAGPLAMRPAISWSSASPARISTSRTAALSAKASSMPADCEPWPGNTNAIFICDIPVGAPRDQEPAKACRHPVAPRGYSKASQYAAPCKAATDALHHDELAGFYAAVATRGVECQGNTGRRGVGMDIDSHHHLLDRQREFPGQCIQDAHIGLVRHDPVD